ncbi:GntR family transcriptional regulator [Phytoactinopolyspora mesophila]|uniref:UTRA domain-containing protein n=1 Tax=Phytoactinopolyspora mesophila TaxID=2650750 RepID=A0A7K3MCE2_9ACTN|nr:GntR family transcriptional regulator [Phytoactinopolyspora mesophila]NDL60995.1 UTRA domain-containing protein [Phytoactinopolyspora mesophila]
MPRKLERPAAPYRQIAEEIRARILEGDLQPGDVVPSVRAVSREYGVAMATAHRALSLLQAEGYARPERGIGSVVTTDEERGWSASARLEKSQRTGKVYPSGQHARIVAAALDEAPDQVAKALGVEPGSEVIRRLRITYRGDRVVSRSTSWFPAAVSESAPLLLTTERIPEGTFAYVAHALGRQLGSWQDQYDPAVADADEAATLDVAEGTPIFRGQNWIYDDNGDVLEYGESIAAARISYRGNISD